ncbi:MAG: Spy/CpxP family protein refolding chaperone [Neolewinella sp.]|jgi:Spy/CpxP family protein refolding chaperone
MRKLMMTTLVLLLAMTIVAAQPGQGERGHKSPDLYSQLDLTAEQQEQIRTIKTEARAKAKASRELVRGTRPDRTAMTQLREENRQAIEAVLTPEQREKFAKLAAERKAARESVDKKALKQALQAHQEDKIAPVIKAARGQLNQFISAEDQLALDRLREVFKNKPGAKLRGKEGAGTPGQRPTPEQLEAHKALGEAWREAHTEDIAELKALTTKYQADLERIQTHLKPQMEAWAKEKKEIVRSHLPEGSPQKNELSRAGKRRNGEAQKHQGHKPGKIKRKNGAITGWKGGWPNVATFLLMES